MIKKRLNFTRIAILAGILSIQMGCSSVSPDNSSQKTATKRPAEVNQPKTNNGTAKDATVNQQQAGSDALISKEGLSSEVLYYLFSAEIAAQRGEIGLSAALYTKAAEITRDARVAQQATRIAYYARDDKRAISAAKLWYELEPNNLEARQVLAALLVRAGKTDEAADHFEYVLTNGKHSERQGFLLITTMLSKEQDKQAALAVMTRLLATRKNNPNALFAYAQLAYLVGNLDDAAKTVKNVINMQPDWTEAHILQANIFVRQGYKAHAVEVLRQTLEQYPDKPRLRMFYARSLVDAKQFAEAATQFEYLIGDEKQQYEARYALGLLLMQMNKPGEAAGHFEKLVEQNKRKVESQYYLAQSYEMQNKLQQAINAYKKVNHNEYGFEAKLRTAQIMTRLGKVHDARQLLQNMSPDSLDKEVRVYIAEGELLNSVKRYSEAFDLYTEALKDLTDNNRLLYARALSAEKLGKIDLAVNDLHSIVKREPQNAQALNALGYTLIDKTSRINEGLEYVKKALELEPDDPAIHDSIGWAYYRLGNYDEALKYLKRAFAKLKDPEIAAHLGEVLWVAGEHDAAQEIWDAALQQAPDHDLLRNVMQKFAE